MLQLLSSVTLLEFATTTTGAGLIASRFSERFLQLRVFGCQHQHDLCRSAIAFQQFCHDAHRLIDVRKKCFVASTQVIQPWLTIWCLNETVLGTFPMTGEAHLALTAVTR